jgi:murein L,D-transpeptidase YcbB/YkuD
MKNLFRSIGLGCLLAGGILYFTGDIDSAAAPEVQQLKTKNNELKKELETMKEALAVAQTISSAPDSTPKVEKEPAKTKEEPASEQSTPSLVKAVLLIETGSNSTTVSATLERLGIIKNANDFNDYLTTKKLEGKIQIGEHEVDSSMDFKTLAQVVTKSR